MVEFTTPDTYLRQITVFLKERMNQQAYNLSQDLLQKFPGELISHVLMAETAFRIGRYQESKVQAQKSIKLAKSESDIRFCALIFSTACMQLKDYIEGYSTLKSAMAGKSLPEVEEALLVLSMAMADEQKALQHMKNLMTLNRGRTMDFMKAYAAGAEPSRPQPG